MTMKGPKYEVIQDTVGCAEIHNNVDYLKAHCAIYENASLTILSLEKWKVKKGLKIKTEVRFLNAR
jgi:hypothetical protein